MFVHSFCKYCGRVHVLGTYSLPQNDLENVLHRKLYNAPAVPRCCCCTSCGCGCGNPAELATAEVQSRSVVCNVKAHTVRHIESFSANFESLALREFELARYTLVPLPKPRAPQRANTHIPVGSRSRLRECRAIQIADAG